jgi:hypothetical protein
VVDVDQQLLRHAHRVVIRCQVLLLLLLLLLLLCLAALFLSPISFDVLCRINHIIEEETKITQPHSEIQIRCGVFPTFIVMVLLR